MLASAKNLDSETLTELKLTILIIDKIISKKQYKKQNIKTKIHFWNNYNFNKKGPNSRLQWKLER